MDSEMVKAGSGKKNDDLANNANRNIFKRVSGYIDDDDANVQDKDNNSLANIYCDSGSNSINQGGSSISSSCSSPKSQNIHLNNTMSPNIPGPKPTITINKCPTPESDADLEDGKLLSDEDGDGKRPRFDKDVAKKRSSVYRLYHSAKTKGTKSIDSIISEDSIYLVALGVLMGIFSFAIDVCVDCLRKLHFYLFMLAGDIHAALQYATWVGYTLVLVLTSTAICHFVAPLAVGSGIPEMKTILRGVVLKEYLTFRTLVAKFLGLIMALGTGLPIGKEGPFVHIASMLAGLLSRCARRFKGIFENESQHTEMLAAACAVGVASTYGAPIGGVLFSIEVTSVFFPLRNYWRGFLSTVCSAITFRLLAVLFQKEETVVAFSPTNFPSDYPFDPKELFVFALIGIFCGFGGALFVWLHRKYVKMFLQNPALKKTLFKYWVTYPVLLVFILASIKCPLGYGHYFAGGLTPREALDHLFSEFSWLEDNVTKHGNDSRAVLEYWADGRNIFVTLALFAFNMFWMTAVAITLPIPSGVFIPVFVTGAAFGRLVGETMASIFPNGVRTDGVITKISPGAYAIVGATSFSGAVTHAISTSVVVVEITGQILYILPTMLGVLIANAVCAKLQPSIYDSIIQIKKLPYIPAIPNVSSGIHRIYVRDLMVTDMKYITLESTYRELQDLLIDNPRLKTFPLVDRHSSLILLGSISRAQLLKAMDEHVGEQARKLEASRRFNAHVPSNNLHKAVLLKAPSSKSANKNVRIASADESEMEPVRKNSRFTIRKVSSHEILTDVSSILPQNKLRGTVSHEGEDSTMLDDQSNEASSTTYHRFMNTVQAVGNYMNSLPLRFRDSFRRHATSHLGLIPDVDLIEEERTDWEKQRLNERLRFDNIQIDPAPFQLVERTSLYRVHALFWMLGLNRAYVTSLGRLVGVVALRELRQALEKAQPVISTLSDNDDLPRRKKSTIFRPENIENLEKKILQSSNKSLVPSDQPKRLFSINPSMCFVPNQSETLGARLWRKPSNSR